MYFSSIRLGQAFAQPNTILNIFYKLAIFFIDMFLSI